MLLDEIDVLAPEIRSQCFGTTRKSTTVVTGKTYVQVSTKVRAPNTAVETKDTIIV
jgi:hypothetical protein